MNYSDNTTPLHVLLKELIDRSNYTVYQLAKVCDVNRSTLQKAISGQRPISRDNLDKLIPYLHLTVSEQKELQKSILISEIGEISYQKNIYEKMYPASTTKIMTAYLALTRGNPDDIVTVSEHAVDQPSDSSVCGLRAGEQIKLSDLL